MSPRFLRAILPLALLALAGCQSGNKNDTATLTAITVTPSLGKVSGASVRILDLAGTEIGTGNLGANGDVTIETGKPSGNGYLVQVIGQAGAQYFDEASGEMRPFPKGAMLQAVSAGTSNRITVSVLTALAAQRAQSLAGAGKPITLLMARQANEEVAALLGGDVSDITAPISLIGATTDHPDTTTAAGKHAYRLAALADYAAAEHPDCTASGCDPLLDMMTVMASDFADGALDGKRNGTAMPEAFYARLGVDAGTLIRQDLTALSAQRAAAAFTRTGAWLAGSMKGSYALSCAPAGSGAAQPATLDIAPGGAWKASGPWGEFVLGEYSSSVLWRQQAATAADMRLGREKVRTLLQAVNGNVANSRVIRNDGISLCVSGCPKIDVPITPSTPDPYRRSLVLFDGQGSGVVRSLGQTWQCTGFPALTADSLVVPQNRLGDWLPDGLYDCSDANGQSLGAASINAGQLVANPGNLMFSELSRPLETQTDPADATLTAGGASTSTATPYDWSAIAAANLDHATYTDTGGASSIAITRNLRDGAIRFQVNYAPAGHPERAFTLNQCNNRLPKR